MKFTKCAIIIALCIACATHHVFADEQQYQSTGIVSQRIVSRIGNFITVIKCYLQYGSQEDLNNRLCTEVDKDHPNIEAVEELLDCGANANASREICVDFFCVKRRQEKVITLARNAEALKVLLDHGAHVDGVGSGDQATALINAIFRRDKESVDLLLKHQANVNYQENYYKGTPLSAALMRSWDRNEKDIVFDKTIAMLLIAHGANVNKANYNGDTPLHLALMRNFSDIATLLIQHGAHVHARSRGDQFSPQLNGDTPLHALAQSRHDIAMLAVADQLLKAGADVNACSSSLTPLDWLDDKEDPLYKFLVEHGAQQGFSACPEQYKSVRVLVRN